MNRRSFVLVSTATMIAIAVLVGVLALYSKFAVKASVPGLPQAVSWLPSDSQAVFGMNVRKFVASPIYAKFEAKHGERFGRDLQEFISRTGVDPRRDVSYVVASAHSREGRREDGVVIAVGQFNREAVTAFIESHKTPIRVDYKGTLVLMVPEGDHARVEKGIAYISDAEIAVGELETLKSILDVRSGSAPGILTSGTLAPILADLNPDEMFWFAGDASRIVARAPAGTPVGNGIAALNTVVGTLNLTDAVTGKITAAARDEESARKLADVARGAVALGQLAGEDHPKLAELIRGVTVTQEGNRIRLVVNFPIELLEQLEHGKPFPKGSL